MKFFSDSHKNNRLVIIILLIMCAQVIMATTQAAGARKAQIRWTGFGIEMAGDVDRDGLINVHPAFTDDNGKQVKSDLTKEPFVFWINDDDDDETA